MHPHSTDYTKPAGPSTIWDDWVHCITFPGDKMCHPRESHNKIFSKIIFLILVPWWFKIQLLNTLLTILSVPPGKTPKSGKTWYLHFCIYFFCNVKLLIKFFHWRHFIDNRTIFLVVVNMRQLALIKLIFQFLSAITVGKVRCKLHPPASRRYWLPGEYRKSYWQ